MTNIYNEIPEQDGWLLGILVFLIALVVDGAVKFFGWIKR